MKLQYFPVSASPNKPGTFSSGVMDSPFSNQQNIEVRLQVFRVRHTVASMSHDVRVSDIASRALFCSRIWSILTLYLACSGGRIHWTSASDVVWPVTIACVLTKLPALVLMTVVSCGRAHAWYRDLFVLTSVATASLVAQSVAAVAVVTNPGDVSYEFSRRASMHHIALVCAVCALASVVWWACLVAARALVVHDS